jgi:hypothetical protein
MTHQCFVEAQLVPVVKRFGWPVPYPGCRTVLQTLLPVTLAVLQVLTGPVLPVRVAAVAAGQVLLAVQAGGWLRQG